MPLTHRNLQGAAAAAAYTIGNSVYPDGSTGYFTRTPASAGNVDTWTLSFWIKLAGLGANRTIFGGGADGDNLTRVMIDSSNQLIYQHLDAGAVTDVITTTQVFRDPEAWYHIVVRVDTTDATESNRVRIYINGSQVTALATTNYPAQNVDTDVNSTAAHEIGRLRNATQYFDGYLSEFILVDGQSLAPSSFGEIDANTGSWKPKQYTGTYGTNGFYLKFNNSGNLGGDSSGGGKNFTTTGTVTQTTDSPTDKAASNVGNYCTWNKINAFTTATLSNGNLTATGTSQSAVGNIEMSSGKWFFAESALSGASTNHYLGVVTAACTFGNYSPGHNTNGWGFRFATTAADGAGNDGLFVILETVTSYRLTNVYAAGDMLCLAIDIDAGKGWFGTYDAGTTTILWGDSATGLTGDPSAGTGPTFTFTAGTKMFLAGGYASGASATVNFGATAFTPTIPTGFKRLSTANLPAPTIKNDDLHFNVVTYTGTGSALSVTGVGFQPDFVWIKSRSAATDHAVYDAVRGVQKRLETNQLDIEASSDGGVTSFDSDGFTLGTLAQVNTNTATYVAWCWKANGSGSSNTDGSITSTVSANTTAGISVVKWVGVTGAGQTVGHGLGAVPKFAIFHDTTSADHWFVYHGSLANTEHLYLDTTGAKNTGVTSWNSSTPTSSVFAFNGSPNDNTQTIIGYIFAEVAGFSKFGSYTGNGSADGPFVWCGFRPAMVILKRVDAVAVWEIHDKARNPYNPADTYSEINSANAEFANEFVDFLSNGFKIRDNDTVMNSGTVIFAAFAEFPFGGTGTAQGKAR